MSWDFETEPEYQAKMDWANQFVREKVEPLDYVLDDPSNKSDQRAAAIVAPLHAEVRAQGLWATHLDPELGGQGYGQVKLALLNEIVGRSKWGPTIFGCQAPDSGNAEIIARHGSEHLKRTYLKPLLNGEISSGYAMTEPHSGADPSLFTTRATRAGDDWLINGEKWFVSNARHATFFVVMAVTDPDAGPYRGMSQFIVPASTPGITILRFVGTGPDRGAPGSHAYMRFTDVRVGGDNLLGDEGGAFAISQNRLSGGRVHHAMRSVGQMRRAFDLMCERAVSRRTRNGPLGDLQITQERIAESWVDLEQFRLLVLRTAWLIDKHKDYRKVRKDIAAVKAATPRVLHDIVQRAMHLHGSLGVSNEMPFWSLMILAEGLGIADGPTEIHQQTLAREILKGYEPVDGLWPSGHLPTKKALSAAAYADHLENVVVNG